MSELFEIDHAEGRVGPIDAHKRAEEVHTRIREEMMRDPLDWDADAIEGPVGYMRMAVLEPGLTLSLIRPPDRYRGTLHVPISEVNFEADYLPENMYAAEHFLPGEGNIASNHFNIIQYENGETKNGEEVIYTRAESELVFLMSSRMPLPKENYAYRLEITKGSEIIWPSLINGEVVPSERTHLQ